MGAARRAGNARRPEQKNPSLVRLYQCLQRGIMCSITPCSAFGALVFTRHEEHQEETVDLTAAGRLVLAVLGQLWDRNERRRRRMARLEGKHERESAEERQRRRERLLRGYAGYCGLRDLARLLETLPDFAGMGLFGLGRLLARLDPDVFDPPRRNPEPTDATPGTEARIAAYAARYERGEQLHHADDYRPLPGEEPDLPPCPVAQRNGIEKRDDFRRPPKPRHVRALRRGGKKWARLIEFRDNLGTFQVASLVPRPRKPATVRDADRQLVTMK